MKITTSKTITEKMEVAPPLFWKDGAQISALLDENTFVKISEIGSYSSCWIDKAESCMSQIASYSKELEITEEEFFAAFNKVYQSLNINPVLK